MNQSVIGDLRRTYLERLCGSILGYRSGTDIVTVADGSSAVSKDLAERMVQKIGLPLCPNPATGQTAGTLFGLTTKDFVQASFARLRHLRPGNWIFSVSQADPGIAMFDQYEHLGQLSAVLKQYRELDAALGGDYLIKPDIVVAREPVSDEEINSEGILVSNDDQAARFTPIRAQNFANPRSILHASISCKWTMRSDRAQNTRTEALNLIRNRKGNTPHIVAVTMEPMPSRIASIALGTGDIDCTYHAALFELMEGTKESGRDDQAEMLLDMVNGRRLRDISDLPFDLAI